MAWPGSSQHASLLQVDYCTALLSSMADTLARRNSYWSRCGCPHTSWVGLGQGGREQPTASPLTWASASHLSWEGPGLRL